MVTKANIFLIITTYIIFTTRVPENMCVAHVDKAAHGINFTVRNEEKQQNQYKKEKQESTRGVAGNL